MTLAITTFYAGILALLIFWIAIQSIKRRRGKQISLSDGGDEHMLRLNSAMRNATEYIPIFLIMMAGVESLGAPGFVLHLIALLFVTGRILHAWHFITARTDYTYRKFGMHLTLWPLLAMAVGAIAHGAVAMVG